MMVKRDNKRPTSNKYEKEQEIHNACMLEGHEDAMQSLVGARECWILTHLPTILLIPMHVKRTVP